MSLGGSDPPLGMMLHVLAGRKPSNRSEKGKPWLRGLAISFVTDAVDPTCLVL